MENVLQIERKLQEGNYVDADILRYLSHNSITVVYNTLHEIAYKKIKTDGIIMKVTEIASSKNEISSKGLGALTMRIVAIATLNELNLNTFYNSLDEDEKKLAEGAFS
ncbi:hypothetical protein QJV38_11905 [Listeria cossartiae subsp. cayugensis]|uniref:Phage protein n=1 Tax=Listeria cossartiae subsp. cayugensis TaxID=2713505 RepID=A0ABU2IRN9_9LIST|nr:hypothetical protein [Listeria cossartiae]MDT0050114.1 hypothetical protein [Listeria cossartiae subsp. cayugensis]MDT0066840.1 hypothetical protein [Listeria cossartiae subsp. cayugensis]MDT0080505.1 hypothetical protein [Listeria cossartiae subsp. cayugensis]MDT0083059.1 hypothetical protein [Listeria cossartiae subsp. cayugensis]MDT0088849.1 hypothetical protein [Listeria cossartiae subsp. cayugensis]